MESVCVNSVGMKRRIRMVGLSLRKARTENGFPGDFPLQIGDWFGTKQRWVFRWRCFEDSCLSSRVHDRPSSRTFLSVFIFIWWC